MTSGDDLCGGVQPHDGDSSSQLANLVGAIRIADNRVRRYLEADVLRGDGEMSFSAYLAMALLHEHGEMLQRDMLAQLHLSRGTVSGVLARLERRGLVERRVVGRNKAAKLVRLADRGRVVVLDLTEEMSRAAEFISSVLTHEELVVLRDLVERLAAHIGAGE